MKVKIDTKEKFHVITVPGPNLSANMTADLYDLLLPYLQHEVYNIVLSLRELQSIDESVAESLVKIQQKFYEHNASFIICELQPAVDEFLDKADLLEMMNVTPTESEAGDIVQMEELEREFTEGEEF